MRFPWIFLLILQSWAPASSQQHYYIYIQADNQQPFYSSIGKEIFSSSASGYVIIPRLKDSTYQVTIGFPADKWPEYIFNCTTNKKDRGFLLKNFNEKGWGLFNLQTMEVIMGNRVEKRAEQKSSSWVSPTNDEFTIILASVVDDADLRRTELIPNDEMRMAVTKEEVKKPEENKKDVENKEVVAVAPAKSNTEVSTASTKAVKNDSPALNTTVNKQESHISIAAGSVVVANADTVKVDTNKHKPTDSTSLSASHLFTKVSRTLQYSNKEGMEMIYVDDQLNGAKDTIRIFIPAETAIVSQPASANSGIAKTEKKDSQFLDMSIAPRKDSTIQENPGKKEVESQAQSARNDTITNSKNAESLVIAAPLTEKKDAATQTKEESKPVAGSPAVSNVNCKKMATEKDVNTLRSRMIVIKDDDDIVNVALKSFKQKCFSSENIKALCYVFITDQGKYKLMDAAYPYVYDQENFSNLAFLLTETYYVNRFNALVKNN